MEGSIFLMPMGVSSRRYTLSMAVRPLSPSAMPESTAQDWELSQIFAWGSALEPTKRPLSIIARRYHSPSHARLLTRLFCSE